MVRTLITYFEFYTLLGEPYTGPTFVPRRRRAATPTRFLESCFPPHNPPRPPRGFNLAFLGQFRGFYPMNFKAHTHTHKKWGFALPRSGSPGVEGGGVRAAGCPRVLPLSPAPQTEQLPSNVPKSGLGMPGKPGNLLGRDEGMAEGGGDARKPPLLPITPRSI